MSADRGGRSPRAAPPVLPGIGNIRTMRNGATTTIDAAGRLVIPKAAREAAGLRPGDLLRVSAVEGRIEIVPEPREVRIVRRGRLSVAVPREPSEPLRASAVRATLEDVRSGRGRRG